MTLKIAIWTMGVLLVGLLLGWDGAASAQTVRAVMQAEVKFLDPQSTTADITQVHGYLVYDTLFALDAKGMPQPQMVDTYRLSADKLTYTFTLRDGLKWHDGEKVTAKDCVASLARWSKRDPMGLLIAAVQKELTAVDDRTFKWVLGKPFPKMLLALGKNNTPCAFMMPERLAKTDAFQQITEYVGSGPMKFAKGEWVPGAKAVFERFADYVPRSEPSNWLSGGKKMYVDRVEWVIMPDAATASAALQNGEIDWWEIASTDLAPILKKNKNVKLDIADPLGNIGSFRFNHLHPPFNNVKARLAVLTALSQEDYMRAVIGDDTNLWKTLPSFFTPGTPLYTEEGGDILKGPRNIDAAKKLLAEAGYKGEPITCVVAQDQPLLKPMGEVTADLLKKIGMTVDFVATDWGTVGSRRAKKEPPGAAGGWHMFHTWHAGADCVNPASYTAIRANGDKAWFGWPNIPTIEKEVEAWFEAKSLDEEKAAIVRLNKEAFANAVYAPTGFFQIYQAWRTNVTGIVKGPLPFFWDVKKA